MSTRRDLVIVDDFYELPDSIRELALRLPYSAENDYGHFERTPSYFPDNIVESLQLIIGRRIAIDSNWLYPRTSRGENLRTFNGTFYRARAGTAPPIHIHHDNHDYTAIVFLSPSCPAEYGTAFYEFAPTRVRAASKPTSVQGDEPSRKYGNDFSMWSLVDYVGYRYNRLVVFPSNRYHAARMSPDNTIERLGHLFLFNLER